MIHRITRFIEIDVLHVKDLHEAIDLAIQHEMPSVVVHPNMISQAIVARASRQGTFKIITAVDWDKASNRGIDKFKHLPMDVIATDGFEVAISDLQTEDAYWKELQTIVGPVTGSLCTNASIRICIDMYNRSEESWMNCCRAINRTSGIDYIRTDRSLSLQQSKANATKFASYLEKIRSCTGVGVKLSGNVNSVRAISKCKTGRFGVSLKQAKDIIKGLGDAKNIQMLNDSLTIKKPPAIEAVTTD